MACTWCLLVDATTFSVYTQRKRECESNECGATVKTTLFDDFGLRVSVSDGERSRQSSLLSPSLASMSTACPFAFVCPYMRRHTLRSCLKELYMSQKRANSKGRRYALRKYPVQLWIKNNTKNEIVLMLWISQFPWAIRNTCTNILISYRIEVIHTLTLGDVWKEKLFFRWKWARRTMVRCQVITMFTETSGKCEANSTSTVELRRFVNSKKKWKKKKRSQWNEKRRIKMLKLYEQTTELFSNWNEKKKNFFHIFAIYFFVSVSLSAVYSCLEAWHKKIISIQRQDRPVWWTDGRKENDKKKIRKSNRNGNKAAHIFIEFSSVADIFHGDVVVLIHGTSQT